MLSDQLSERETRAAQALLAGAGVSPVTVRSAEPIWDRSHVLRLTLAGGRTVVLKRDRDAASRDPALSFAAERAALGFLSGMDPPVAPRLLGADDSILLMEDLGPGVSLAHSLLGPDAERARADLVAYARTLGAVHAWSAVREDKYAESARAAGYGGGLPEPPRLAAIAASREPFLDVTARLGLPAAGVRTELDSLPELLRGPGGRYTGLVHGDACPDNTRITGGSCGIFDFEASGWGPVAIDAAYLLAPFPSCWCFGVLPAAVTGPALAAYRDQVSGAGITLGADWEAALTAALGSWVVARTPVLERALDADHEWGTTSVRPRLLTFLRSFTSAAAGSGALPRLAALAGALQERLAARWPGAVAPDYPALARPGAPLAEVPRGWAASQDPEA